MGGSDPAHGLSDEEVRARRQQYGRSELAGEKPIPAWASVLLQVAVVYVPLLQRVRHGCAVVDRLDALPGGSQQRVVVDRGEEGVVQEGLIPSSRNLLSGT
jgi:hypothetical protein